MENTNLIFPKTFKGTKGQINFFIFGAILSFGVSFASFGSAFFKWSNEFSNIAFYTIAAVFFAFSLFIFYFILKHKTKQLLFENNYFEEHKYSGCITKINYSEILKIEQMQTQEGISFCITDFYGNQIEITPHFENFASLVGDYFKFVNDLHIKKNSEEIKKGIDFECKYHISSKIFGIIFLFLIYGFSGVVFYSCFFSDTKQIWSLRFLSLLCTIGIIILTKPIYNLLVKIQINRNSITLKNLFSHELYLWGQIKNIEYTRIDENNIQSLKLYFTNEKIKVINLNLLENASKLLSAFDTYVKINKEKDIEIDRQKQLKVIKKDMKIKVIIWILLTIISIFVLYRTINKAVFENRIEREGIEVNGIVTDKKKKNNIIYYTYIVDSKIIKGKNKINYKLFDTLNKDSEVIVLYLINDPTKSDLKIAFRNGNTMIIIVSLIVLFFIYSTIKIIKTNKIVNGIE